MGLAARASLGRTVLAVFLGVLGAVDVQAYEEPFDSLSRDADRARLDNRLLAAADLYRKALEVQSGWIDGWWHLGTVLYELDRHAEAKVAFSEVVQARPESAEAFAFLGLCRYESGEYREALRDLQRGLAAGIGQLEGLGYTVQYHFALLLSWDGQFELAARILVDLARLGHFEKPAVREALGISALRLTHLPGTLPAELREPVLLAGGAMTSIAASKPDQAAVQLKALVTRFPTLPSVHFLHGNFLAQTEPNRALDEYLKELEISPDHVPALLEVAFEYLKRGEPLEALPFAEKAVRWNGGSFVARNALGRALLELDRVDEAIAQLEEGIRLAPDSPQMYFSLARAYRKAGRAEEAAKAQSEFQRLRDLVGEQP